jgi:hypothetical protein
MNPFFETSAGVMSDERSLEDICTQSAVSTLERRLASTCIKPNIQHQPTSGTFTKVHKCEGSGLDLHTKLKLKLKLQGTQVLESSPTRNENSWISSLVERAQTNKMKSLLLVVLLIVVQSTCFTLRFTHSRYILSRFSINSSINPKTTSSYYSGTSSSSSNIQSYPAFNNRAGRPNKSVAWMSTEFDEYCREAQGILPEHADSKTISSIAFHLMKMSLENDMLMQKSANENEMLMQKSANELRQSTAFHSKQLSAVVQRLVVRLCLYASGFFSFFFVFRHLPYHFFALSVFCFHTDKSSRAF